MAMLEFKKLQSLSLLGIAAFLTVGCSMARGFHNLVGSDFKAKGPQTKEPRSVNPFTKLEAGQIYDVDVTLGSRQSVVLEAPKDLLTHLTATVSGSTLKLGANLDYSLTNNSKVKAHVVVPHLDAVTISGAGKLTIITPIEQTSFAATATGAAKLQLSANVSRINLELDGASQTDIRSLKAQNLNLNSRGAAQCTIKGSASNCKIEATGASILHAKALSVDRADVKTEGAATTELRVTSDLHATASGASNVRYIGNPKTTRNTTGASSIENVH